MPWLLAAALSVELVIRWMTVSGDSGQMVPGTLFTVSAPSGAGKTSLVNALVEQDALLQVSVSHTTRQMRPGEEDGVNYHFVDAVDFQQMVDAGDFLEHAEVFGNCYGTSKHWVLETLRQGMDVVLEIDWQGAALASAWAQSQPDISQAGIFILPPSIETLKQRLTGRGQDEDAVIAGRMAEAVEEISHYEDADFLVVNDDFGIALSQLQSIVESCRLAIEPQTGRYRALLDSLLEGK